MKNTFATAAVLIVAGTQIFAAGTTELEFPNPYPAPAAGTRLTPPASEAPHFNGTETFGALAGCEVVFRVPVSGKRPMKFSAKGVPAGVNFDETNGIFRGTPKERGQYKIIVTAKNAAGTAKKTFILKSGNEKIFAPPMGWNSWYVYSEAINAEAVEKTAHQMVETGLADFGWSFVNIDDCWQGTRGGELNAIQGNARFPDMKKMCGNVHELGLKIGIYSTPWISTYAGFIGGSSPDPKGNPESIALPEKKRPQKTQFFGRWPGLHQMKVDHTGEYWFFDKDAKQWAQWGFDFVKTDWKPNDAPTTQRIAEALDKSGRSIILSLSNAAPFENMPELAKYANLTRTTGDITDTWGSIKNIGFAQERWQKFLTRTHFPDPDMLQVGNTGTPNNFNVKARPTRLAPDEQYTQISLWAMLSAPMLLSCDLGSLDDFTRGLLCNSEIVNLNQCGGNVPAKIVLRENGLCIWQKGNVFGFFNLADEKKTFEISRERLGEATENSRKIFDLWTHKRFRISKSVPALKLEINAHGVRLLRFE